MKPGIYIGLPEDEYHAIDARGSTDVKQLFEDPVEWQYDRLMGEPMAETASRLLGSAIHKRLLEGRDAFEANYYCKLSPEDFDDPLVTVDDLKTYLKNHNQPVGGKKSDLIERVQKMDTKVTIWDLELEHHRQENDHKTELSEVHMRRVELAAQWCQEDPLIGPFMEDGAFRLGLPEVSVVTEVEGVLCKQRIDLVLPRRHVDLKSFTPMMNSRPVYALPYQIKKFGYDLQAGHYQNVWEGAKDLPITDLTGHLTDKERAMLEDNKTIEPSWVWVFIKTTKAPQPFVEPFYRELTAYQHARRDARYALKAYTSMVEKWGADNMWPPHNKPFNFGDEELLRG